MRSSCARPSGVSGPGTPVSTSTSQRANGERKRDASASSTAADSLPRTSAATVRRLSTSRVKGRRTRAASPQPPATTQRQRTSAAAKRSDPAIFPERAVAAGGECLVGPAAHSRTDLAHPLAIPDLGDRLVPDVPENLLSGPVVRAEEDAAVVQDVGRGEGRRAVPQPGARGASPHAVEEGDLSTRQTQRLVELGKRAYAIVGGVDEDRNAPRPPARREGADLVGVVAQL